MGRRAAVEDLPDAVTEEAAASFARLPRRVSVRRGDQALGSEHRLLLRAEVADNPRRPSSRPASKTLSSRAALANGTMALGFEYADFAAGSRAYPFAVTAPLALAESRHKSGRGSWPWRSSSATRSWRVIDRDAPAGSGFYVPALYGTFGAAAGAARVLGLSAHHTNYALGLAAAFTGGTFQGHEEGAWQRSLNGGMASESGRDRGAAGRDGVQGHRARARGRPGVRQPCTPAASSMPRPCSTASASRSSSLDRWVKGYPDEPDPACSRRGAARDHRGTTTSITRTSSRSTPGGSGWSRSWPSTRCRRS